LTRTKLRGPGRRRGPYSTKQNAAAGCSAGLCGSQGG
jgi:hypothetical protein